MNFQTRTLRLVDDKVRSLAVAAVQNAPAGIEVVLRVQTKVRGQSQNALMWASAIRDISDQAWVNGRQFSSDVWHEYFKKECLPEADDPELERLVKEPATWQKWSYLPDGERVLIGSSTKLTTHGFSVYLEQVHAIGAKLGVMFGVRE